MEQQSKAEEFVKNLLLVMPGWHSRLVRPFKDMLDKEMSLETYYCLQTVRMSEMVRMTDLAQQLSVPKQQATKLVDKLSGYGFVERVYHEKDRRAIWIRLTPAAIRYLDEYYLKNTGFIQKLEESLTQKELEELNRAVETIGKIIPRLE